MQEIYHVYIVVLYIYIYMYIYIYTHINRNPAISVYAQLFGPGTLSDWMSPRPRFDTIVVVALASAMLLFTNQQEDQTQTELLQPSPQPSSPWPCADDDDHENEAGCCLLGPVGVFGTVAKALSLLGAQQLLEHAWTKSAESPTCCPGAYLYLHQRRQCLKKLPHTGFADTLPRIHDQKTSPSADSAFSGPSAARIENPRARDVEIKAFLNQRRVSKGRLVYPLPPRGLKERPPPGGKGVELGPARAFR